MNCITCQTELEWKLSIKTEEAERPIEISYQWWFCPSCNAKYYGVLEDSNVNMFDDRLRHQGYKVEENKWKESLAEGLKCPKPDDSSCTCAFHKTAPPTSFNGEFAWYTYD